MAVTSAQQTAVSSLYIALFNRVPDAAGLDFWATALSNGASVATISLSFLNSPEAKLIYAGAQTSEQFVSVFYQTVFGRAVDAGGLAFWSGVMNAAGGIGSDAAKALLVSKIVDIVSTPIGSKPANVTDAQYAETIRDRAAFDKKVIVSIDFAVTQKNNDVAAAKLAFLDAPPTPGGPPAPEALVLRLTGAADNLTGGAGNDTFDGALAGGIASVNNGDTLDGGAGTDTLNITLRDTDPTTPRLSRIEIVNLTATHLGNVLDLFLATGVEQANIMNSTATGLMLDVRTAALSVSNQSATAAFSGSTASLLSLKLSNVGAASSVTDVGLATGGAAPLATAFSIVAENAYARVLGAGSAVRSVTVAATGANALNFSSATNLNTLNVTGAGSVDFSIGALAALTTFTAGNGGVKLTSTGTALLTILTGSGADTIVANGASIKSLDVGAGNDVVTLNTSAMPTLAFVDLGAGDDTLILTLSHAAAATVDGGAGRDTLQLNSLLLYSAMINKVTGFEVLALGASGFNVDRLQTGLINSFAVANTGTTTFTNADNDSTFAIDNSAGVTAVNVANSGAGSTHITLTNNAATPAANAIGTLNVSGATQIFLTSSGSGTNSNVITSLVHANVSTITVQGTADLDFAILTTTRESTVDASAFTGKLTVRGSSYGDIITGGAGDDAIYGGGGADTLTGGSGNDIFSFYGQSDIQPSFATHPSDNTIANIDKITDFSGNGALDGDRISFGTGRNVFSYAGNDLTFNVATRAMVRPVTVAFASNFYGLGVAIESAWQGWGSIDGIAQVYDVTVNGGSLAGRYMVLNDAVDPINAADTFISINGIVGALDDSDFVFGVGAY